MAATSSGASEADLHDGLPRQFTVVLIFLVVLGISIFALAKIGSSQVEEGHGWREVLDGVAEVGVVAATSGAVLLLIEQMALDRIVRRTAKEVESVLERQHETLNSLLVEHLQPLVGLDSGIRGHFPQRKDSITTIINAIEKGSEIKLLGVCHSIFWQCESHDDGRRDFARVLYQRLVAGSRVEIVYLDRAKRELYQARDYAERLGNGTYLLMESRKSLNRFALPLYFKFFEWAWAASQRMRSQPANETLEEHMRRFELTESPLPPSLSVTIIDDHRMFVAPYIADDCDNGPCHEYAPKTLNGKDADDWDACMDHYNRHNTTGRPLFSEPFLQWMCLNADHVLQSLQQDPGDDPVDVSELVADEEGPYERFVGRLRDEFVASRSTPQYSKQPSGD